MKFLFTNIISESKILIKNKLRLFENERELGASLASQMNTPYVVIYRAAPMSANEFYDRDYVTLSKKFAIEHAESNHVYNEEAFHVIQALVSTKDVFDASNPGEYFYHGPNKKAKEIYVSLGPDEYEGLDEDISFGNRKTTKADLRRTQERIDTARAFIARQPLQDQEDYWNKITHNHYEQGFIASAVVDIRGDVQIRTYKAAAGDVRQNQYDLRGEDEKHIVLPISAHPGIDHPNTQDRSGHAKTQGGINNPTRVHGEEIGSPASDAQIKAYAYYGEVILDFLKSKMTGLDSYTDGSGAELANETDPRDKILMLNKELKRRLRKNVIVQTEWKAFLNALIRLGVDLHNIDFRKDLATDEQWGEVIKMAGLSQTQAPMDNDAAYKEKLAAMDALKARHRR